MRSAKPGNHLKPIASSQTQVTTQTATDETAAATSSNELIRSPLLQISSALP